jgi:hypothetical protein
MIKITVRFACVVVALVLAGGAAAQDAASTQTSQKTLAATMDLRLSHRGPGGDPTVEG